MADSIIMERVADAEPSVSTRNSSKRRTSGPSRPWSPRPCERSPRASCAAASSGFDAELVGNMPRGWSVHERAVRTLVTLVGGIAFVRTVFRDEFGRRRALADELLGIPPRARVSPGRS